MKTFLVALALIATTSTAFAADESSRAHHKFSIFGGMNSDPFGFTGGGVGYNLTQFLRVSAGYSSLSTIVGASTVTASFTGGGLKFFVPGWNLSPYATVGYTSTSATGTFNLGSGSVSGSFGATYYGGGLEWATNYGLMLGFGEQAASGAYSSIGMLPTFYLGWAF